MKVHWELAKDLRRRLFEPEYGRIGCVQGIPNSHTEYSAVAERRHTELDRSKCFIRLSCESLLDLEQPQLLVLSKLCHDAHRSEEFFFFANATDQWLRTAIGHEILHPQIWIGATEVIPDIIIQSNVLPYDPYWSKPPVTENEANMTVHFPSRMLEEALNDRKTLKKALQEWRNTGRELCDIGSYEAGRCEYPSPTSELFSEIQDTDVQFVRVLSEYGDSGTGIRLITWRGGQFIQKTFENSPKVSQSFDMELEVLERFSHPHLIYSFGKLDSKHERSYFMEYMSNDLRKFILEMNRVHDDDKQPPFETDATVDILLQVAKAMRHMHQENVNVVHCDLKSQNILISEIAKADAVKHYLVKVADFGSARLGSSRSEPAGNFIPGNGTTAYSAPEVLRQLEDRTYLLPIDYPHKIDVYSFGIVAFEVLTGIPNDLVYQGSRKKFKEGVIKGTQRPPLRAECKKHELFIQDEMLLSLIERCWHEKPSERPDFVEICEELGKVRAQISERELQTDLPRRQNPIMTSLQQGLSYLGLNQR